MGCCASAGGGHVIIRVLFALLVVAVTGPLALLFWPLSFVGLRVPHRFFLGLFTSFSQGLLEDLKKPLIGGSLHCKLSGRLLHHSPRLSGLVYNYFNLFLALPLIAIVVLVCYLL